MKVLFLMFAFVDLNKSFNMYTALVEEFNKNGNEVFVIAPGQPKQKTGITREKGIQILRIETLPFKNVNIWKKGIANLLLPFQYKKALKKFYPEKKFDLIFIPTPPITLVDLADTLKNKFVAKVYLILRDIFPQNAVDLGFIGKNTMVYSYFRKKEKKLYKISDFIGCMSQGNIDYIKKNNPSVDKEKLHELKNFQKVYQDFGFNKDFLKEKYGIENKFVLIFGGNMGKPQQLENVLELAKRTLIFPDVIFLFIGEGVMIQKVSKQIEESGITNIRLHKTIAKQEYQDLLTLCDVGIISLHKSFTIPNIPSKSLDYWNVGLPVLASVDYVTDFGKILNDSNSGLWSYAGDHENLFNNFLKLYKNPDLRQDLAKNGKKYFTENLTPEIAYQTIMKIIGKSDK